MQQICNPSFF
jgi:hypothetical protein